MVKGSGVGAFLRYLGSSGRVSNNAPIPPFFATFEPRYSSIRQGIEIFYFAKAEVWLSAMKTLVTSRMPVIVAVAILIIHGSIHAAENTPEKQGDLRTNSEQLTQANTLYKKYCALCHGESGEGYAADNANALANQNFLMSVNDEFLWSSIANGRPFTAMAAHAARFGGPLDDAEIDALVDLIRSWQQQESIADLARTVLGDPVSGRAVYNDFCVSCHGDEGQGVSAVSLNNPEFLAVASDGQIRFAISDGRSGTPMGAFKDLLKEDAIDDLVALIRSWQKETPVRDEVPALAEFPEVVINPDGPAPEFILREGRYLSSQQLHNAMLNKSRLIILDARPPSDWYLAHIPGAVPAPSYDPESIMIQLPEDDTWIISYCACPHKYSDRLMDALREEGFKNTAVLDEGVRWWQLEGYPIDYGP